MSDFEDDFDDDYDFEFGDYFYVEDTEDLVGDLAEHAIASPPPVDYSDDAYEWDRFAYWNDIEYDSDGYHDIDTERIARQRRKETQSLPPNDKLKRRADHLESSPAKRRKGRNDTSHPTMTTVPEIMVTPVEWRVEEDEVRTPLREEHEEPFAILKNWREQFPEVGRHHDNDDAEDMGEDGGEPVEIGQEAILAALRANLGKLTGGAGAEGLGAEEDMLLQHITKMLSEGGASLDDIAGGLTDALFAPDDASVASEALDEKKGDGDFGQWVLQQAEAKAGPSTSQQAHDGPSTTTGDSTLGSVPLQRPSHTPTPASYEGGASSNSSSSSQMTVDSAIGLVAHPSAPRSRKRKVDPAHEEAVSGAPAKRAATHSFNAPTASSRARSGQVAEKPLSKMAARKAGKNTKK